MISYPAMLPGGGLAAFTHHALDRYIERVRPHLQSRADAAVDARRLIAACAVITSDAPPWLGSNFDTRSKVHESPGRQWIHCGDVCFVAEPSGGHAPWSILTTVARGGISDAARAQRNRYAAGRRRGRRYKTSHRSRAEGAAAARTLRQSDLGD